MLSEELRHRRQQGPSPRGTRRTERGILRKIGER